MNEKAILTPLQARTIEDLLKNYSKKGLLNAFFNVPESYEFRDLGEMDAADLAQALFADYEIKEGIRTFSIPVVWAMEGTLQIEACTEDEAIEIALNKQKSPKDGSYVDGSFDVV